VYEYLAYGLFVVGMIGCLGYVMRSLETEEASDTTPRERDPR
jgi:hypothetical protein